MEHELITRARALATRHHEGQTYGDHPYLVHLEEVCAVLRAHDIVDPTILAAAYLHDALEDTDAVASELRDVVGDDVVAMVSFCTDAQGSNRKERKARTNARMRAALEGVQPEDEVLRGAVAVKMADRIANIESCVSRGNDSLLRMYQRETPALLEILGLHGWWPTLRQCAQQHLVTEDRTF